MEDGNKLEDLDERLLLLGVINGKCGERKLVMLTENGERRLGVM